MGGGGTIEKPDRRRSSFAPPDKEDHMKKISAAPGWRIVMIALVAGAVAGCATLFNSGTKSIPMSSNPSAAEVWINEINRGATPITLELMNHESHTVVFRKEGYQDVVCELTASVGAGWVVLDLLGGLLPIIIDAATGEWKGIKQDTCNVNLPSANDPQAGDATLEGTPEADDLAAIAERRGWVTLTEVALH